MKKKLLLLVVPIGILLIWDNPYLKDERNIDTILKSV